MFLPGDCRFLSGGSRFLSRTSKFLSGISRILSHQQFVSKKAACWSLEKETKTVTKAAFGVTFGLFDLLSVSVGASARQSFIPYAKPGNVRDVTPR